MAADREFGPTPMDFLAFQEFVTPKASGWGFNASQVKMSFQLLDTLLEKHYDYSMDSLVSKSKTPSESTRCSQSLALVAGEFNWSDATLQKYMRLLKLILKQTTADINFINGLRIIKEQQPFNRVLGKKFERLDLKDPQRVMLEDWIEKLRAGTQNKSELSLRNVVSFYLNTCLPKLDLTVAALVEDPEPDVSSKFDDAGVMIISICGEAQKPDASKKARWLSFLLRVILKSSVIIPDERLKNSYFTQTITTEEDDGSDFHRITSKDLDAIHHECARNPKHELLFLLMITTGLRVGATAQILIRNVADVSANEIKVRPQGRTKEKGNKCVTFVMTEKVQAQVHDWLAKSRPADTSAYLFPGKSGGHISTDARRKIFKDACQRAGLRGKEFHPHALRHSFAHLLLETGNSVDVVSKCLNHASSSVTEKFYLKENAAQVVERANIPWMQTGKRKEPELPNFLGGASATESHQKQERKRSRAGEAIAFSTNAEILGLWSYSAETSALSRPSPWASTVSMLPVYEELHVTWGAVRPDPGSIFELWILEMEYPLRTSRRADGTGLASALFWWMTPISCALSEINGAPSLGSTVAHFRTPRTLLKWACVLSSHLVKASVYLW